MSAIIAKAYVCENCGVSFTRHLNMLRHKRESCIARFMVNDVGGKRPRLDGVASTSATKTCTICNVSVPANRMAAHQRTTQHKHNSCVPLCDGVQLVNSAFKSRIATYRISSNTAHIDFTTFFNDIMSKVFDMLEQVLRLHQTIKANMNVVGQYFHQTQDVSSEKSFNTPNKIVDAGSDLNDVYHSFVETMKTQSTEFQEKDSAVHIVNLTTNRSPETSTIIHHTLPVLQLALDQQGPTSNRILALLDKSRDLYIVVVKSTGKTLTKLGRKIDSFKWNAITTILAAIQDAQLIVWYCPTAAFNSKLLQLCSLQYDSPELGRNPRINDFVGNSVSIRRADGSLINVPISPYPDLIYKKLNENKWTEALDLCRSVNSDMAWACLAVLATQSNSETVEIAEEAYANINHYEKVFYIQFIKNLRSKPEQKAHLALLGGKFEEAESILLHNGMVFQAIYININLHNWQRALDLATKHKTHIDTVLYLREKYLESLGKAENNNKYSSLRETTVIDPEKIEEKIAMEQRRKLSH